MNRRQPVVIKSTKRSESVEQQSVFNWRAEMLMRFPGRYPGIDMMLATLNGAYLQGGKDQRSRQWAKLKREGAKEGVSDILLPVPVGMYSGLWIEMKTAKGTASETQKDFGQRAMRLGYYFAVCRGAGPAQELIKYYYSMDDYL